MRRVTLIEAMVVVALVLVSAGYASAQEFFARLDGIEEVGAQNNESGPIRTEGRGTLRLRLDKASQTATYTLDYSDVGTTPPLTGAVTQAHIHFGPRHVAGGIMVFLCTNLGNGPAGTPPCPANSGTVSGTLTSASVVSIAVQNVAAGDFGAFVEAITENAAYANIHTTTLPRGEIRGQVLRWNSDNNK